MSRNRYGRWPRSYMNSEECAVREEYQKVGDLTSGRCKEKHIQLGENGILPPLALALVRFDMSCEEGNWRELQTVLSSVFTPRRARQRGYSHPPILCARY